MVKAIVPINVTFHECFLFNSRITGNPKIGLGCHFALNGTFVLPTTVEMDRTPVACKCFFCLSSGGLPDDSIGWPLPAFRKGFQGSAVALRRMDSFSGAGMAARLEEVVHTWLGLTAPLAMEPKVECPRRCAALLSQMFPQRFSAFSVSHPANARFDSRNGNEIPWKQPAGFSASNCLQLARSLRRSV